MDTIILIAGIIVVIGAVYFLVRRKESRLVLLAAGILMALLAGKPMAALEAFSEKMVAGSLIQPILSVMGFAFVLKFTGCDKHLVNLLAGFLKKTGVLIIPLATAGTFLVNIALPSAAGTAAAVGAIFIPLMIGAGVRPAMAASAVLAGTFGSNLNPGNPHNAFVGELAGVSPMAIIGVHSTATITAGVIGAISLAIIAFVFKEHKGHNGVANVEGQEDQKILKPSVFKALVPIIPVVVLVLGSTVLPAIAMGVPEAMIIGTLIAMACTRSNPTKLVKAFFSGMGEAYANILGIIIAAGVFVSGMNAIGLVDAFIEAMINTPAIVNIAATFGPFLLAVVSGSGDAAAFAFNEAVTPFAEQFGLSKETLGSIAVLGGSIGRSMSPIAGAAIVCSGIANCEPMELAKRNAPGMIIAAVVAMFILL